jgi:hypothetical protein
MCVLACVCGAGIKPRAMYMLSNALPLGYSLAPKFYLNWNNKKPALLHIYMEIYANA